LEKKTTGGLYEHKEHIAELGSEMYKCPSSFCKESGILKKIEPENGIIPRFLYYDEEKAKTILIEFYSLGKIRVMRKKEIEVFKQFYKESGGPEDDNWPYILYREVCKYFTQKCFKKEGQAYYYSCQSIH
jgi:hypothetical protein